MQSVVTLRSSKYCRRTSTVVINETFEQNSSWRGITGPSILMAQGTGWVDEGGSGNVQREEVVLLLVEASATFREVIRGHLGARLPIRIVEASTAAEAVTQARRWTPAIVLADLSLPDQRGTTVVAQLHSACPTATLVALASEPDADYVATVVRAGAQACLAKESLANQLDRLVWRSLSASQLSWSMRLAAWRWQVRSQTVLPIRRKLAVAWASACRGLRWVDQHGPWSDRPRVRVLYTANVMGLLIVMMMNQALV